MEKVPFYPACPTGTFADISIFRDTCCGAAD